MTKRSNTLLLNTLLYFLSIIMCLMILSDYNQSFDKIYSVLHSVNNIFETIDNSGIAKQNNNDMTKISPGLYSFPFVNEDGIFGGKIIITDGDKIYLKSNLSNGNCIYYALEFKDDNWVLMDTEMSMGETKKEGY